MTPTLMSLDGIRILDLSRILAGPTATQLLADLGADVIKVERPGAGDDTRSWGPPYVRDAEGAETDLSAYFLCANRNKRSIALDLADPGDADIVRRLATISDVVVENYKPGDLDRRGLGHQDLVKLKPDLVWCSISGFGQTGRYAERIGYDFLVQAMGGIMSVTGAPDAAGGSPTKVGVGIADVMCGMYAAVGILAALRHRDRTCEGQHIDLSLYDSQLAWLINAATNHLVSGKVPQRLGNRHPNIAPYQTFGASDGHLVVAVGNDTQFAKLCSVIARPQLADDPRFARNRDRLENIDALDALLSATFETDTVASWTDRLIAAGVPAGPVATVAEALSNGHTADRGMVVAMETEAGLPLRLLGNPLKMSATPVRYTRPPPHLGADRASVMETLAAAERDAT